MFVGGTAIEDLSRVTQAAGAGHRPTMLPSLLTNRFLSRPPKRQTDLRRTTVQSAKRFGDRFYFLPIFLFFSGKQFIWPLVLLQL